MANSKKTYGLQNLALSHKARMILGTSGLGAMDDESIVNTAVTLCPNAATVEEAVECLLDESQLINCPEGVRKAVMSVFCRFEHDDQVGLLGQKLRILEAPIYDTYQILANGGDAVSKIELFKNKKDEDQIIGQTNLGNSKFDEGEFYVATGIQILYGEAANYQDCRFGDIIDENLDTPNAKRIYADMPARLRNAHFSLDIGKQNGTTIDRLLVDAFMNVDPRAGKPFFYGLSSPMYIPTETLITAKIETHQNFGIAPNAVGGSKKFIRVMIHGGWIVTA